MLGRVLLLFWLGLAVLVLPWWLALIMLFAAVLLKPRFYEALVPAALFDLLYGAPGNFPPIPFFASLLILIFIWVVAGSRQYLLYYH